MKTQSGFTTIEAAIALVVTTIAVLGVGGWIANIVKLINAGFEVAQWGGMEVARVIGIFVAPLGAALGFI